MLIEIFPPINSGGSTAIKSGLNAASDSETPSLLAHTIVVSFIFL